MSSIHLRRLAGRLERTGARVIAEATRLGLGLAELPSVRVPWYEIRGQTGEDPDAPDVATVFLFDEIGGSMGVQSEQFVTDLNAITAATIHLRINSPGGAVFEAIAMSNALRHHPAHVVAYVDALAASAASVVAVAADEVVMMPGSQMMIHDASSPEDGNADEHRQLATWLDRQSDNAAELYRLKGGHDVAYWRDLMLAETWMFADEAVEFGLADRVEQVTAPATEEMMTRGHDLSRFGYRYADRAGAPAPGTGPRVTRSAGGALTTRREGPPAAAQVAAPASLDKHEAARLRAQAARSAGTEGMQLRSAPPCGTQRRVSTQWMTQRMAPDEIAQLKPRLAMRMQERDGKTFMVVGGYYTVYERAYEMWDIYGPYDEIVSRGAGDVTTHAKPDTIFVVNHTGMAMARTGASDTLRLWSDAYGGKNEAWLNPKRDDVQRLGHGIDDKIITEQSFRFMITSGRWSPDFTEYRIDEYDLNRGDTSAVNFGANPYTDIAARSREILDELEHLPRGAARAAFDRLANRADLRGIRQPVIAARASKTDADALAEQLARADATPLGSPPKGGRNDVVYLESVLALAEADILAP